MKEWEEEFKLPLDQVEIDHINDGIMLDDYYFNSYVNYVKQRVVSEREYLFRMLLYMRDCGFEYGGNIYTKSEDKVEVVAIKEEKKEFKKERTRLNYEAKATCKDITTTELQVINAKPMKTREEKNQCYKYAMKRKYKVNNTPVWFMKAINGSKNKMHSNLVKYQSVNGVVDQKKRYELMKKIRNDTITVDNTPKVNNDTTGPDSPKPAWLVLEEGEMTAQLQQGIRVYDAIQDIPDTWSSQEMRLCEHSLNILKIIGAETFIRDVPSFDVTYSELSIVQFKDYIAQNEDDLRVLVNNNIIKLDNLANTVTKKAFGIKLTETPTGFNVNNMWVINQHNGIWPYNKDKGEELQLFIPEVTITYKDKIQEWINSKTLTMLGSLELSKLSTQAEFLQRLRSTQDADHALMNENQLLPCGWGNNRVRVVVPTVNVRKPAKAIVGLQYKISK